MNKITIDEIHEYLEQWKNDETWSDFNMAWDSGYTEYAAYLISSGGAIDSTSCYDDSRDVERAIEKMLKRYTNKQREKDVKACFGSAEIYIHPDTNETAFVRNQDVDYLVSENEMRNWGYVTENEFNEYAELYFQDMRVIKKLECKTGGI